MKLIIAKQKKKKKHLLNRKHMEKNNNIAKKFYRLSYLLRHDKLYTLESGGWRSIDSLITEKEFTFEELCDLVAKDTKGRFEFNGNKTKLRALYGHSVPVDLKLECSIPPNVLYYGTSKNASISILKGLISRNRNYVHLTSDTDSAKHMGARYGIPVIIQINAEKMLEEGYKFYNSTGNIWLVREVPCRFFNSFNLPLLSHKHKNEEWIENKMIKLTCDSNEIIEELKKNSIISTLCEIVHLSNTLFSVHTLEEYFNSQMYIIVITNKHTCNNDLLNKITNFQKFTRGTLLISPQTTNKIPSICATSIKDIHYTLHSLLSLLNGNWPMRVDFADIYTILLRDGGEIKFLPHTIKTNLDMIDFWNELITLIKNKNNQVKSCIVHLSLPKDCHDQTEPIWREFENGLRLIHNISPRINYLYGYSSHTEEIRMLVSMR